MSNRPRVLVVVAGSSPCIELEHVIEKLKKNSCDVKIIAELNTAVSTVQTSENILLIDDYRSEDNTIRFAAEKAENYLKSLRAIIGKRFYHKNHSLWVASETNILHFHLARLFDYLHIITKILNKERPTEIFCIGPNDLLVKVTTLVASTRKISAHIVSFKGTKGLFQKLFWRIKCALAFSPILNLIVYYLGAQARDVLSRKAKVVKKSSPKEINKTPIPQVSLLITNAKQSDVIVQLANYLASTGQYECRLLNLCSRDFAKNLAEKGLKVSQIQDWASSDDAKYRIRARRQFFREAVILFRSPFFRKWFIRDDIDFWAISGDHFCRVILMGLPSLVEYCMWAQAYIETQSPEIMITPGEWDAQSRACVIAARFCGVPTLSVQRGDITNFPGWGEPIFSDLMTVNGPAVKNAMIFSGVPDKQIVITGDPRFDPWINNKSSFFKPRQTYKNLGISTKYKIVAIMTNPVNLNEKISHTEAYISGLFEIAKNHLDLHLVVKLHPSEKNIIFYEHLRDAIGISNVTILRDFNTPQLLYDAKVVVTTISTTGEEAIFLGKPLIVVNLTNEPDFMPYAGSAAAITVRKKSELGCALMLAINDANIKAKLAEGRSNYVTEHMLSDDGQSSKRCAYIIDKLINNFK